MEVDDDRNWPPLTAAGGAIPKVRPSRGTPIASTTAYLSPLPPTAAEMPPTAAAATPPTAAEIPPTAAAATPPPAAAAPMPPAATTQPAPAATTPPTAAPTPPTAAARPPASPAQETFQDEADDPSDIEMVQDMEDYDSILTDFKSQWLLAEIEHSVSKTATDLFWRLASFYFPKLESAVAERKKKPAQFKTIRRQMYEDLLPRIELQIGYKNKASGETFIVNGTVTPLKNYPNSEWDKLFEIAFVKVSALI